MENNVSLLNRSEHIAADDLIAFFDRGGEPPLLFAVERRNLDTPCQV